MRKIKHVKQKTPHSCAVACIAMVAGMSFDEVAQYVSSVELKITGLLGTNIMKLMRKLKIRYRVRPFPAGMHQGCLYIARVPTDWEMHMIVVDWRSKNLKVYDPLKGTGAKHYTDKNLKFYGTVIEIKE